MKRDWIELIPELKDWSPSPQSPEGLARCEGNYPLAIGYLVQFWPCFVEYKGMVFAQEEIDEDSKKNIASWLEGKKGDKQAVEAMLNHIHILHTQHPGCWGNATAPQMQFIGQMLKEMWGCKLARDFPEKKFVVEFTEGSAENLEGYQVCFYQRHSP